MKVFFSHNINHISQQEIFLSDIDSTTFHFQYILQEIISTKGEISDLNCYGILTIFNIEKSKSFYLILLQDIYKTNHKNGKLKLKLI